jgi:hypothetical protein
MPRSVTKMCWTSRGDASGHRKTAEAAVGADAVPHLHDNGADGFGERAGRVAERDAACIDRVSKVEGTSVYSRLGLLASLVILLSMLALRAIYSKVKISRR